MTTAVERRIHNNLLLFYAERKSAGPSKFPLCDEFAQLVFSIHVASAVVETYFSKTKYIKNKHRSKLNDQSASASLHLVESTPSASEILTNDRGSHINVSAAWETHEGDEDDMRMKYVGKRVRKNFEIDTR